MAKDQFYQVLSKMTPFNALKGHFKLCLTKQLGLLVVKIKMDQRVPPGMAKDQFYQVLSKMTPFNALKPF